MTIIHIDEESKYSENIKELVKLLDYCCKLIYSS